MAALSCGISLRNRFDLRIWWDLWGEGSFCLIGEWYTIRWHEQLVTSGSADFFNTLCSQIFHMDWKRHLDEIRKLVMNSIYQMASKLLSRCYLQYSFICSLMVPSALGLDFWSDMLRVLWVFSWSSPVKLRIIFRLTKAWSYCGALPAGVHRWKMPLVHLHLKVWTMLWKAEKPQRRRTCVRFSPNSPVLVVRMPVDVMELDIWFPKDGGRALLQVEWCLNIVYIHNMYFWIYIYICAREMRTSSCSWTQPEHSTVPPAHKLPEAGDDQGSVDVMRMYNTNQLGSSKPMSWPPDLMKDLKDQCTVWKWLQWHFVCGTWPASICYCGPFELSLWFYWFLFLVKPFWWVSPITREVLLLGSRAAGSIGSSHGEEEVDSASKVSQCTDTSSDLNISEYLGFNLHSCE